MMPASSNSNMPRQNHLRQRVTVDLMLEGYLSQFPDCFERLPPPPPLLLLLLSEGSLALDLLSHYIAAEVGGTIMTF